jgi:hypothetical protein
LRAHLGEHTDKRACERLSAPAFWLAEIIDGAQVVS